MIARAKSRLRRAAIILMAVGISATQTAAAQSDGKASIDEAARAVMTADRLPSLSVAIGQDGKLVYAKAFGLADLENSVPATGHTVYGLGSIAKPLTAVATLRLAQDGQIDLDRPAHELCTAFPQPATPVTVRQLLGHLGGIRHYDYRRFEEDFLNRRNWPSTSAAVGKFAGDDLVTIPGAQYHYSSWGYVLLGCAIEAAADSTYARILQRTVLEPAGMQQTRLDAVPDIIPHRAAGYATTSDGSWQNAGLFDPSDRYAAGGVAGTPADLVRFGIALMQGSLLDEHARAAMWSPQTTSGGETTEYGLGWNLNGAEIFHGGSTVGATSYLYLRPDTGQVVAFATNLSLWNGDRQGLARRLAELAAQE